MRNEYTHVRWPECVEDTSRISLVAVLVAFAWPLSLGCTSVRFGRFDLFLSLTRTLYEVISTYLCHYIFFSTHPLHGTVVWCMLLHESNMLRSLEQNDTWWMTGMTAHFQHPRPSCRCRYRPKRSRKKSSALVVSSFSGDFNHAPLPPKDQICAWCSYERGMHEHARIIQDAHRGICDS